MEYPTKLTIATQSIFIITMSSLSISVRAGFLRFIILFLIWFYTLVGTAHSSRQFPIQDLKQHRMMWFVCLLLLISELFVNNFGISQEYIFNYKWICSIMWHERWSFLIQSLGDMTWWLCPFYDHTCTHTRESERKLAYFT